MSLTATLLLGESVTLPRGKKRTHLMDARRVQAWPEFEMVWAAIEARMGEQK